MASKICSGSQLLHPKATTSLMALHPKGKKVVHYIPGSLHPKWHYIQKATTSHSATTSHVLLHPVCHFIPYATPSHIPLHPILLLHPRYHFIPLATSSHVPLHPIYHYIPYTTPSHIPLHPIGHFILYAAYDMPLG